MNKILNTILLFVFGLILSSQKVLADVIIPGQTRHCSVRPGVDGKLTTFCSGPISQATWGLFALAGGIITIVIVISVVLITRIRRKKNAVTIIK